MNNQHYLIKRQRKQPNTIAIRTNQRLTKNCNRASLFSNAFLPTLKTNFFKNSSASIEWISNCKRLIING